MSLRGYANEQAAKSALALSVCAGVDEWVSFLNATARPRLVDLRSRAGLSPDFDLTRITANQCKVALVGLSDADATKAAAAIVTMAGIASAVDIKHTAGDLTVD